MTDVLGLVAVALGGWLASLYLREGAAVPAWLRPAHAAAGAGTLGLTLWAFRARGFDITPFEWDGVVMMGMALVLGVTLWVAWARLGRARGIVVAIHAFAGMAGVALVLSF